MAALGFIPLRTASPRLPAAAVWSSTLPYCIIVYVVTTWSQTLVWWDQAEFIVGPDSRWDDRLFSLQIVWVLFPQILAPWLWLCSTPIRDSLLRFSDYETLYASTTKDTLAPRLTRRRRQLQILLMFLIFFTLVVLALAISYIQGQRVPIRWSYYPAALAAVTTQGLLTMLFTTYSFQLNVASSALCQYLQQAKWKSDGNQLQKAVRNTRRLWVALRALYNEVSYRFVDVFQMLHLLMSLILAVYMFHVFRISELCFNLALEAGFVVYSLLQLGIITNEAHLAIEKMFGPFVGVLDRLSIDMDDARLTQTVSLFYHTMTACPATLTLSGFTTMGRPLFTSVLSATVTYIVIMLQYQQSDTERLQNALQNTSASNLSQASCVST